MAYNSEYQYSSRAGNIIMAYNSEYQYSSRAGSVIFQWLITVNTNTLVELGV